MVTDGDATEDRGVGIDGDMILDDGTESVTQEICGLNATKMFGLLEIGIVPTDYVICIPDYANTDYENIIRVLQWMLDNKMVYHEYAEE